MKPEVRTLLLKLENQEEKFSRAKNKIKIVQNELTVHQKPANIILKKHTTQFTTKDMSVQEETVRKPK
ncbi:hypothetical protein J4408_04295 [Candidatus Pacearchaeota archaeon]|nr:hypothetical protein [Candidatus Pacearchaeota archaeon]